MNSNQLNYVYFPSRKAEAKIQNGSDDSKNLQTILFLFGAFEFLFGLISYGVADYVDPFTPVSFISGLLGLAAILFCILQPASIKVYDVLGASIMLGYGLGSLNTLVSFMLDHALVDISYFTPDLWLTRTLAMCSASAGLLHMAGRIDKDGYIFNHFKLTEAQVKKVIILCCVVGLLFLFQVAKGGIGFMGVQFTSENSLQVSAMATLLSTLLTPVGSLAIYAALGEEAVKKKRLLLFIAITFLLFQFFLGRRVFVFSAIIFLMTAIFARRPKRFITIKHVLLLAVLIFAVQAATTAFMTLRLAGGAHFVSQSNKAKLAFKDRVEAAYQLYMESGKGEIAEEIKKNVKSRTFVVEYLAALSEKTTYKDPLYGKNTLRALIYATPSIIYPNKYANKLYMVEESLANPYFGLPDIDEANSLLTAGVIDFGVIGMFITPLVMCIIYSLVLRLRNFNNAFMGAALLGLIACQAMLHIETEIYIYIGTLRDMFIVLTITGVYLFFRKQKMDEDKENLAINAN